MFEALGSLCDLSSVVEGVVEARPPPPLDRLAIRLQMG